MPAVNRSRDEHTTTSTSSAAKWLLGATAEPFHVGVCDGRYLFIEIKTPSSSTTRTYSTAKRWAPAHIMWELGMWMSPPGSTDSTAHVPLRVFGTLGSILLYVAVPGYIIIYSCS